MRILLAPIHLDALVMPAIRSVVEPMADFRRLPYFDGQRDINSGVPYLSEAILSQPFEDQNLHLPPGIHLHWILPQALARGVLRQSEDSSPLQTEEIAGKNPLKSEKQRVRFPRVPNRWLIRRTFQQHRREWVIESDFISRTLSSGQNPECATTYPYSDDPGQPFRYLGRCLSFEEWAKPETHAAAEYLDPDKQPLTAVGYGEPSFAAFYPNCASVFGMLDSEYGSQPPEGLTYELLGWYSEPSHDELKTLLPALLPGVKIEDWYKAVHEKLGWDIVETDAAAAATIPSCLVCFARLKFQPATAPPPSSATRIVLGNTPSQALAAYVASLVGKSDQQKIKEQLEAILLASNTPSQALAAYVASLVDKSDQQKIKEQLEAILLASNTPSQALASYVASLVDKSDQQKIEEQLEAILLAPSLEQTQVDTGPQFLSLRHERSFTAAPGGRSWALRAESESKKEPGQTPAPQSRVFPDELAVALDTLNQLEARLDQEHDEIQSLEKQLFSDWIRYMVCAYPPDGGANDLPDPDQVGQFIKRSSLKTKNRQNKLEMLKADRNRARETVQDLLADLASVRVDDIIDVQKIQEALHKMEESLRPPVRLTPVQKKLCPLNVPTAILACVFTRVPAPVLERWRSSQPVVDDLRILIAELNQAIDEMSPSAGSQKVKERQAARKQIEAALPGAMLHHVAYLLQKVPAPRYWMPNEPVVLVASEGARNSDRFGTDDPVRCPVVTVQANVIPDAFNRLFASMASASEETTDSVRTGVRVWNRQPWHPFLLEWSAALHPAPGGRLMETARRSYDPGFISQSYSLTKTNIDFNPVTGADLPDPTINVYQGRTILTPHAERRLKQRLAHFLTSNLPPDLRTELQQQANSPEQLRKYLHSNITELREKYENKIGTAKRTKLENVNDIVYSALRAYEQLINTKSLAQTLSGFNQALLMQKQTLQLQTLDPLGLEQTRDVVEAAQTVVGKGLSTAPQPWNDFNPIRSGYLDIKALRLVDSFGQALDLPIPDNCGMEQPPRLTQPARLNFRWLSARLTRGAKCTPLEMSTHPATSPICGWLLPNFLDNSLTVHDSDGDSLGVIDVRGQWDMAPGEFSRSVDQIVNPHLRSVVLKLLEEAKSENPGGFLNAFLSGRLSKALENIEPAAQAHHESNALLVGRPLAVVRATLDLQLKGLPANNQDWNVFRKEIDTSSADPDGNPDGARDTCGFTKVEFPVRLGEYQRLHDGLVGFWKENATASPGKADCFERDFYLNDSDSDASDLKLSVDGPPITLTILVDPRGAVYATCGIQPVKSIQIPAAMYAEGLRGIEVTFLSTPVLTRVGAIELPVPDESEYRWSWLERSDHGWSEYPTGPSPGLDAKFAPLEIREGWLKLNIAE
jgi:hypothetical protein